jgi:hypothetical protein
MGLFDKRDKKKKGGKDDFDSPVEQIDLSAASTPEPEPASTRAAPVPEPAPAAAPEPIAAREQPRTVEAEPPDQDEDDYPPVDYGIDKAIELMRSLPQENVELVVTVVKTTLESLNVRLGVIIKDATRKQENIQSRIKVLKGEIAEYEQEIATRKTEIETLETDFKETSTVKERLQMAEKGSTRPVASTSSPLGAPGPSAVSRPRRPTGEQAPLPGVRPSASSPSSASGGSSSSTSGTKTTVVAKK